MLLISACGMLGDNLPGTVGIFGSLERGKRGPLKVELSSKSLGCLSGRYGSTLSGRNFASVDVATSGSLSRCAVTSLGTSNTSMGS